MKILKTGLLLLLIVLLANSQLSADYENRYYINEKGVEAALVENDFAAAHASLDNAEKLVVSCERLKPKFDSLSSKVGSRYQVNRVKALSLLEEVKTCLQASNFSEAKTSLEKASGLVKNMPEIAKAGATLSQQKTLYETSTKYIENAKHKLAAKDFTGADKDVSEALRIYPNAKETCSNLKYSIERAKIDYIKLSSVSVVTSAPPVGLSETSTEALDKNSPLPEIAPADYRYLVLVNKANPLPKTFVPESLSSVSGSVYKLQSKAAGEMARLLKDMKLLGFKGVQVTSAYRTYKKQSELYSAKVINLSKSYKEKKDAEAVAATIVAVPGTSEHQTGLAVDAANTYGLEQAYGSTPAGKWFAQHSWRYGFVVRYPKGKESITKIVYEPWHLRYVGKTAAKYITEHNLCLEEFVELYNNQNPNCHLGALAEPPKQESPTKKAA